MRTLALVATGTLLASTIAAHATPPQPGQGLKGCGVIAAADPTPGGLLGGTEVYNGVLYGGPIVVADTTDVFANAVDGTLTCSLYLNGNLRGVWGSSGAQSYVVAFAERTTYEAAPTDDVKMCATLDLTNAQGEHATYDLGCQAPNVIPGSAPLCLVTQFAPQPVRPLVEQFLDC